MEFSRQEHWSRLPFPTPRDLPDPEIETASLASPALAGGFFTTVPIGKLYTYILEKAMATHSGTLAWRIPWTEEPGRLQSMGSRRVGHN